MSTPNKRLRSSSEQEPHHEPLEKEGTPSPQRGRGEAGDLESSMQTPSPRDWLPSMEAEMEREKTPPPPDPPRLLSRTASPALPVSPSLLSSIECSDQLDSQRPPSPSSLFIDELLSPFDFDPTPVQAEESDEENDGLEDDFDGVEDLDYIADESECPIYQEAPITLHESLVSILTFALRFCLSGVCIQGLLKLISLHCSIKNNIFKKSLYLFKKYFSNIRGEVSYKFYCSKCLEECPTKTCKTCGPSAPLCYLITLPLIDQLKKLFKRKGFYSKLRFNKKKYSNGISDIFDGKVFRELVESGVIKEEDFLTFLLYTDGASIFKSSKLSVWPLLLTINELPYCDRFSKENILVPAVWCGPVKPPIHLLVKPIMEDLRALANGVNVEVFGGIIKLIKGLVIAATGDTPARGLMLNMTAHNGECSCQKCEQKGEPRKNCVGVRVFPYRPAEMKKRTKESFERHGKIALNLHFHSTSKGLKGPTTLCKIMPDPVRGMAVDAMHLIYGGVSKTLTKFFVDKAFNKKSCNVSNVNKNLINDRLLSIKVPAYLTRVPQSTADLATWKTSLWKSFCLYFALPVFKGIVSDKYYRHYATLVAAVQYLNAEEISEEALIKANQLILKFVSYFEDLYGRDVMTLSIHLLLHLPETVADLGPLWVTSCFPQESVNGILTRLVHGTRYAEMQIASSMNMVMGLPDLVSSLPNNHPKHLCEDFIKTTTRCKSTLIGDITVIGNIKENERIPTYVQETAKVLGIQEQSISIFNSIRKDRCLYVSDSPHSKSKRDSSCISYWQDEKMKIGIIKTFLKVSCHCVEGQCNCNVFVAIQDLKVCEDIPTLIPDISVPNIHIYEKLEKYLLVPVNFLHDVCIKMEVDGKLYVACRCNRIETE